MWGFKENWGILCCFLILPGFSSIYLFISVVSSMKASLVLYECKHILLLVVLQRNRAETGKKLATQTVLWMTLTFQVSSPDVSPVLHTLDTQETERSSKSLSLTCWHISIHLLIIFCPWNTLQFNKGHLFLLDHVSPLFFLSTVFCEESSKASKKKDESNLSALALLVCSC